MKICLSIGINYNHQRFQLRFAESDAVRFSEDLKRRIPDVQVYCILGKQATRSVILQAFRAICASMRSGDTFFFYFSGHGTSIPDNDGDECNGRDEAILPVDAPDFHQRDYLIVDDQFFEMASKLKTGVRFRAFIDACHAGTMMDLPRKYQLVAKAGNPIAFICTPKSGAVRHLECDALVVSSSKSSQKSFEDSSGGMMTTVLLKILSRNPSISPLQLLREMTQSLDGTQTPVISSVQEMPTELL